MPTQTQTRRAVADLREQRQEDFERWQQDRWRRDEITDQSERLASPMVNTFDYKLTEQGLVTDLDEPLRPVFETGLATARYQASQDTRWQFELERREIELEELGQIEQFAANMGEGVRMTSLSLDGSDYGGMRAIAEALGHRLPAERPSSEDILRSRLWTAEGMVVLSPIPDAVRLYGVDIGAYDQKRQKMVVRIITALGDPLEEHEALIHRIRSTYDMTLTTRTGHKHYAGRMQISNEDAKSFIERQGDLLDAHMAVVNEVFAATNDPAERNKRMNPHRYNFAAALDDRLHDREVASLAESGDAARSEGKTFDGDCPTAESATTATEQVNRLGYRTEKWSLGTCLNCTRTTDVWKVEDGGCSICRTCAAAHTARGQAGLDAERNRATQERAKNLRNKARAEKLGHAAVRPLFAEQKQKAAEEIIEVEGMRLRRQERLGVGGTVTEYVNIATGVRADLNA